jgi:hypothetical protein
MGSKQNHSNYFIFQSVKIIFILFYLMKGIVLSSKLKEFSPFLNLLVRASLLLVIEKLNTWKKKLGLKKPLNFKLNPKLNF